MIPGLFLVLHRDEDSEKLTVSIWDAKTLEPHWTACDDASAVLPPLNTSPHPAHTFITTCSDSHNLAHLSALEHPFYPGVYKLWLSFSCPRRYGTDTFPVYVREYQITFDPVLRQHSVVIQHVRYLQLSDAHEGVGLAGISFSGNAVTYHRSALNGNVGADGDVVQSLIGLDTRHPYKSVNISNVPNHVVHISPYSGTVWYRDAEGVLGIEYYD